MNSMTEADIIKELKANLEDKIEIVDDVFMPVIRVETRHLIPLLSKLKEEYGFNYLANLSAVDYEDKIEIVYNLYSVPDNRKITVKVGAPREHTEFPSASAIWAAADWQEREAYDLMGVKFTDHPNLERILLPDDFTGHPLRKDFKMAK